MESRRKAPWEIDCFCRHCKTRNFATLENQACTACQKPLLAHATQDFLEEGHLNQCALCGCAHLYQLKDFNRKLGVFLLVLGFALAYWTYGLSVLALTLLDFWLYKKVGMIASCYECGAVYRNFEKVHEVPEFKLQLHDYYKSVRKD